MQWFYYHILYTCAHEGLTTLVTIICTSHVKVRAQQPEGLLYIVYNVIKALGDFTEVKVILPGQY